MAPVGTLRVLLVLCAALAGAAASAEPPLQQLEEMYQKMLNGSCGAVGASVPAPPAPGAADFMTAYQAFNGTGSEADALRTAGALLADTSIQAFMRKPWVGDALDVAMVKCAVLHDATPLGLAQFAVLGEQEERLVSQLLGDALLMRDMLVAGGPAVDARDVDAPCSATGAGPQPSGTQGGAKYGQAMQVLQRIKAASRVLSSTPKAAAAAPWDDRNQSTMLHRLALGTALGHAVPVPLRYKDPAAPSVTTVDPVARYLHYERHYLAGDLDPAMEVLTAFELRWTTNSDAEDEDLLWLRTTMGNYRPENIAMDYSWRYAEAVHTDVAYGDPQCSELPGICNGHYAQIPAAGGECGPRAFFGRFARKAYGLPTWGVTQPGHAAMSAWTPDGWRVLLGADWMYSWWGVRGGDDFYLETQCRELRGDYQAVLRGAWAAKALGEAPVDPSWSPRSPSAYGQGGLWSALMLYAKKLAVNATAPPPRVIGPSVVPTKVAALLAKWPQRWPTPNVTTNAAGTIVVPGAALASHNASASLAVMKSFDEGEQLLHNTGNYVDPAATSFSYAVSVPEAGVRYLTVNHTTWHMNTDLMVQVNTSSAPVSVPVYYTVGYWNQTQPVAVDLLQGVNVLTFSRASSAAIAIKEIFLYVDKPVVPPPPKNHSSKPIPKPSDYIEVPATTTCAKQGITDVPQRYCALACEALGLKFTGAKPRTNMTGCFALTSGQWNGDCNFNTNASAAVCSDPPCTVFGSIAQQLCSRT